MATERKNFQQLITESDVPVLVDVYSDTCGPCIAMKPVLTELKQKMGDSLRIIKINGYTNAQFMQEYQIQAFPTLMLFNQGRRVWTQMGFMTAPQLEQAVRRHVAG